MKIRIAGKVGKVALQLTHSDVSDLRFLKASAAMERISLLLRSLKGEIQLS